MICRVMDSLLALSPVCAVDFLCSPTPLGIPSPCSCSLTHVDFLTSVCNALFFFPTCCCSGSGGVIQGGVVWLDFIVMDILFFLFESQRKEASKIIVWSFTFCLLLNEFSICWMIFLHRVLFEKWPNLWYKLLFFSLNSALAGQGRDTG